MSALSMFSDDLELLQDSFSVLSNLVYEDKGMNLYCSAHTCNGGCIQLFHIIVQQVHPVVCVGMEKVLSILRQYDHDGIIVQRGIEFICRMAFDQGNSLLLSAFDRFALG